MKVVLTLFMVVAFAPSSFARAWPEWFLAHVTEIRFRDGVPGEQLPYVVRPGEIETILTAFRRAQEVRGKDTVDRTWQVCIDVIGQLPEAGRWLLNLDTGDCTLLNPLAQPVYRFNERDREILKTYFRKKDRLTSRQSQRPLLGRGSS